MNNCPLCHTSNCAPLKLQSLEPKYYHCAVCDLRFIDPENFLAKTDEKDRYLLHENKTEDLRYQEYLRPLHDQICKITKSGANGLDYGAGQTPVLAAMLERSERAITIYDPLFWPNETSLDQKYQFIVACEVIEHFYKPSLEFNRLRNMLVKDGQLFLRTSLFTDKIDFNRWHYRRDPTHVVFYSAKTIQWITREFKFSAFEIQNDSVITLYT